MSLTRTERGVWTRTPTCYSRRPRRLLLDVPCGVEPPGHFARSGNASHHGFQQGSIGLHLFHTKKRKAVPAILFDKIFHLFLQFLFFVIFWSIVASSFHAIQYFIKKSKIKIKMSISFSYLTTMAWEKFVEKYDDFMRNSKTKINNEKTIKNYVFV